MNNHVHLNKPALKVQIVFTINNLFMKPLYALHVIVYQIYTLRSKLFFQGLSLLRFIPTKVKNTLLNFVWPFQDF